jgi:hypothetical protein
VVVRFNLPQSHSLDLRAGPVCGVRAHAALVDAVATAADLDGPAFIAEEAAVVVEAGTATGAVLHAAASLAGVATGAGIHAGVEAAAFAAALREATALVHALAIALEVV